MSNYAVAYTPSGLTVRYQREDELEILPILLPAIAADKVLVLEEECGAAFVPIDAEQYLVCPLNVDGTISGDWNHVSVDDVEEDVLLLLQQHKVIPKDDEPVGKGVIKGMRCPACGQYESFFIYMRITARAHDDCIYAASDYDWGDDSECTCTGCGHDGIVSDFKPGK